jgi:hypothetical protein
MKGGMVAKAAEAAAVRTSAAAVVAVAEAASTATAFMDSAVAVAAMETAETAVAQWRRPVRLRLAV